MLRPQAGIQVDKFYPPTDWLDSNNQQIDIRKNAENNSIVLLAGHSADFTKYSLLGLLAQVSSGTYDVYIDDVLVGSGITSNTQYDIDFSTIATSYGTATTPEELVLHKIVIKPTTSGATITKFHCARTTGVSTSQNQGVLWCHLELSNSINLENILGSGSLGAQLYVNRICFAVTSSKNKIEVPNLEVFRFASSLKIFNPLTNLSVTTSSLYFRFSDLSSIKRIIFDNFNISGNCEYGFYQDNLLEQINTNTKIKGYSCDYCFRYNRSLKMLPNFDYSNVTSLVDFLREATSLFPTKINLASATSLKRAIIIGSGTYPMRGLRGLKVSNEAPFSGSSPQIDVSYTGLDRDALVELFQSLPTVTGSQTLKCAYATGNNLTKVGSPTIDENGVASGFSSSNYFSISGISTADKQKTRKSFELKVKVTLPSTLTNSQIVYYPNHGQSGLKLNSNGTITFLIYSSGTTVYQIDSTTVFSTNEMIYVKAVINNNLAKLFTSYDGNSWNLENSLDLTDMPSDVTTDNYSRIGVSGESTPSTYFAGTIFLEETYVKVEQNYLMKGYITDTDKAIATDKGWGLVLS